MRSSRGAHVTLRWGRVTGAFLFPNKLAIYGFLNVWNAKNVKFANIRGINYWILSALWAVLSAKVTEFGARSHVRTRARNASAGARMYKIDRYLFFETFNTG